MVSLSVPGSAELARREKLDNFYVFFFTIFFFSLFFFLLFIISAILYKVPNIIL